MPVIQDPGRSRDDSREGPEPWVHGLPEAAYAPFATHVDGARNGSAVGLFPDHPSTASGFTS